MLINILKVLLLGAACCTLVTSTHFRGAIIMVRPQPEGGENEMEISYHVSWRRDYNGGGICSATTVEQGMLLSGHGSLICHSGCRGTITSLSYFCTDFSLIENWSFGENRIVYTFPSTSTSVTIGFSGRNWIAPFNSDWNVPTTFSLTRRNDTGCINSTPRGITSPVIRLQEGCNHTLPIAVSDPDSDIVRCRWGIGSECGGICNRFPGAILDSSTCTFTYEANRGTGFNAAAIVIEDFIPGSLEPLSSVALQFLIFVFASTESCSRQPQFVPPTIIGGSCVAIPSGTSFFTQIIANSSGASASITELQTTSPLGLRRSEIQRIQETDNYFVNITWTPQANQENQTHLFCYTAVNSDGLASEQNCIQFMFGTFPPQPLLNSAFPNQALVHPVHTTWTVSFDQDIQRPSIAASVRFFDNTTMKQVYKIDASFSPEISFNNSEVFISPAFRFPEKAYYFITLDRGIVQGLEGCGPGNEPIADQSFWTFETMDITPPVITFVNNPSRTNENITIDWMSNEEVTWTCVVVFETENSLVNCSQASWDGEDLMGGSYKIEIAATDLAGNAATVSHNFIVDLTPPVAFINQRPALVSNQLSSRLTFSCNEICTFGCLLLEFNSSRGNIASCNQQFFSTPILEHNKSYVFVVIPTDDVGNRGQEFSYTWETDFENPRIASLSNTSTLCSEVSPDITGRPTAFDNRPEPVSIRHQDLSLGCYIQRTWTATDVAGNIDNSVQFIALEYSLSISFVPVLAFSCDSTMGTFNIPASTASAPNPCMIPLDLTFTDSVSEFTCPGEFTRSWSAQSCGSIAEATQTIRFFNTCPPNACGRTESPPRGTCTFGQCSCTRLWSGSNCSVQIFEPEIGIINDTVLEEAEPYILSISLLQGTPPLSWTLISSPAGLRLNANMQQIVWARVRAGNHTVSVSIENEVGIFGVTWTLVVGPGYTATLDPVTPNTYPRAQPVTLTGRIEYFEGNQVRDFLAGIVPVSIDIRRGATTQTLTAFSLTDGTFSIVFNPAPTEYGSYTAQVRHPQLPLMSESVSWLFLGFRLIPSSISLSGETLSDFQETFHNTTMICNDGPADLTRLHMTTSIPTTDDLQVEVFLKQDPLTRSIKTGECIFIDITATSSRALRRLFVVRFETDEGASTSVLINLRIQQIPPRFLISPSQISARIIQGKSIILQFNITNTGRATALNVQPILPNSPIFSLIGLGNNGRRYGNGQFDLKSEESASLSIQAMINDKMPLGEISASFYIVSNEVSQQIPVSLTVSSDTLMNLTLVIEDEYTYFASGDPLVSDAVVTIINYQRNIRTTVTTEERVGSALFVNIFEDRYEVFIEAPDHRSLHQVVITTIDNPTLTFFLERQAVTYTWSVTPVAFEDTYTITLEADFETNVPIPVVTVSPTEFDLEELELGFVDSIQLNITNHGLIRADDVNMNLPTNHPFLEFTVDDEFLGYLEALSSVTAVVHISRRSVQKRALGLFTQITWIVYFINIAYSFVCRDLQIRNIPVVLRRPEIAISQVNHPIFSCSGCEGGIGSGRGSAVSIGSIGPFLQPSGSSYFGGGDTRSSGSVPLLSFNGFFAITPAYCNDCLQNLLSCFPTPKFPLAGCIPLIVSGSGINGPIDIVKWINCLIPGKWVRSGRPKQAKLALEGSLCIYGVYDACFSDSSGGSSRKKRQTLLSTVNDHLESMYPIDLSLDLAVEIFGDDMWLSVGDPEWVSQVLEPIFDDASEDGVLISSAERLAILSVSPPGSTTIEDVEKLLNRLNNTLSGWNSGQPESINGSNIASYSFVESITNDINRYNEIAVNKGFSSYLNAYTFSANEINQLEQWEEEEGICAIVRIRIEQELAITREAFLARLEIDNQEDVNLEQMTLEIIITDSSDGSVSATKFVISNETLGGLLVGSGDTWTLMSGGSGSVEWLIVPLSEAAPESNRVYGVGGTLRYSFENENITIPLLPTLITVTPDPSLLVHYFWERVVVADDPFTEEVEPSIPFTLGVIVKNAGYGVANSLTLSSGQPEIIENEKGLLINFMIIGANIGNSSITPSLSLILGDLAPQSTVVVRWFMISSLQGEFRNFSATFQNINPLGDSRLSILDELQIHELIRNVKIYSENDDDGILDFLVNERRDIGAYPDGIYDSKTLIRYNVSRGPVLSVQPLSSSTASLEVSTTANETGWIYYRYTDVGGLLSQTALTLNTTKLTTTGYVQIPPENSWITLVDETLVLHILDFYESIHNELSFIVTLCTSNCTTTAIPFIGPTGTPPPATTIETTTDVSVNETEGTTTESGSDCKSNCTNTTMESTTVSENTETTTESSLNCTHNCSTTAEPFTRPTGTPNITVETTANDSVSVNEEATTESGSLSLAATMLPLLVFVSASFAENI